MKGTRKRGQVQRNEKNEDPEKKEKNDRTHASFIGYHLVERGQTRFVQRYETGKGGARTARKSRGGKPLDGKVARPKMAATWGGNGTYGKKVPGKTAH